MLKEFIEVGIGSTIKEDEPDWDQRYKIYGDYPGVFTRSKIGQKYGPLR